MKRSQTKAGHLGYGRSRAPAAAIGGWFCLAALTATPSLTRAQSELPELTVEENGRTEKLELRELSVDVRLEGILAETILELEFFNHTARRQEGEFSLQLPQGATVSTYALDIRGKMRPGVSVEKEKARHAYESIKRQMIDPGLVEREAGNIYRTRIFPIEPNQPKRVRIGYISNLAKARAKAAAADDDDATLPFQFAFQQDAKLKSFRCRVAGAAAAPVLNLPNLPGPDSEKDGEWFWQARNVTLKGELKAQSAVPVAGEPRRLHQRADDESYFSVQARLPGKGAKDEEELAKPKKLRLIWDASFSGRNRDHDKEITALKRYWKWLGDAHVSVEILRNRLEPAKTFQLRAGESKELEAHLRDIDYDGAADYSLIKETAETTLLITDGQETSPIWKIRTVFKNHNLFLLTSGGRRVDPGLLAAAIVHADLGRGDWWDRLTGRVPIFSVQGLAKSEWTAEETNGFITVTGRLSARHRGDPEVRVNGVKVAAVPAAPAADSGDDDEWIFARRLWSQQRLRALESAGDRERITAFAKSERLVSDYTSLIVLERFEDHLTYRIPPPEPDLLAKYEAALEEKYDGSLQTAARAWKRKRQWYQTDFPWMDSQLHEESAAVAIWVKASRTAFTEDELDRTMIDAFESWLPKARTTIDRKNSLKNQKDFIAWKSEVGRRIEELKRVREKRLPPEANRPIHVSVRGFVNSRGVLVRDHPLTLREAIELSGGPFMVPLTRVYLYRDAQRTGYNLESAKFREVTLLNGDMIVVEADVGDRRRPSFLGDGFAAADPFAAPAPSAGGGGSPSNEAPIFEETGAARDFDFPQGPDTSTYAPESKVERKLSIQLVNREPAALPTKVDQAVLDALGQHPAQGAGDAYREMTKNTFVESAPSVATLIEIARFFFDKGDAELATRVLSNLVEIQSNKTEATRAFAYWLAEFGETGPAAAIFNRLAQTVPDEATRAITSFDLAQVHDRSDAQKATAWFEHAIRAELDGGEPGALTTIALTDYFGRSGQPRGTLGRKDLRGFLADPMISDVRIVVTSAGDQLDLFVTEPESKEATGPVGVSRHGGRVDQSHRVQEYQLRFGMPGSYRLICHRSGHARSPAPDDFFTGGFEWDETSDSADLQPITIQVAYHTRWGTPRQETVVRTYLMEGVELELDGIEFGWGE